MSFESHDGPIPEGESSVKRNSIKLEEKFSDFESSDSNANKKF